MPQHRTITIVEKQTLLCKVKKIELLINIFMIESMEVITRIISIIVILVSLVFLFCLSAIYYQNKYSQQKSPGRCYDDASDNTCGTQANMRQLSSLTNGTVRWSYCDRLGHAVKNC